MRRGFAIAAVLAMAVAGCVPTPPVVSAYNGDSVSIQQDTTWVPGGRNAETDAEAARICAKGSRKTAEYASSRQLPVGYVMEHLYLCL